MADYAVSERLKAIAEKVIAENDNLIHLRDSKARTVYQTSTQAKKESGKIVYADTERIRDKYKAVLPYDFIITFYWPNCEILSEDKLERLMYHELRHIGIREDGAFFIVPHDVEDFRDIIDSWGFDWI